MSTSSKMKTHMDIWLRRAMMLPSEPAVVHVYLWDCEDKEPWRPTSHALLSQLPVISHYASQGADVSILDVSASFRDGLNADRTHSLQR